MIAVIEIRVKQIDYHSVRDKGWFLSNRGAFGRKGEKMRFKLTPRSMLFAVLCVCLTSIGMLFREGFAAHHKPQIAFFSARDGNSEIYVMDADGKNQRRLTSHPATDFSPSWSPDGNEIAFSSYRNGGNIQIYVMDSDGQNPTRLSDGVNDKRPAWSPDGQRIAIENSGWGWGAEIYVMDNNGENTTRLTNDGGSKRGPSWSPDGKSIVFLLNSQVSVMDSDGKNPRKLTDGQIALNPTWSPDSEMIAYESWRRNDGISEIHLMTADGEYIKKLSRPPERGDWDPNWISPAALAVSPAGNRITIWGRLKKLAPNLR